MLKFFARSISMVGLYKVQSGYYLLILVILSLLSGCGFTSPFSGTSIDNPENQPGAFFEDRGLINDRILFVRFQNDQIRSFHQNTDENDYWGLASLSKIVVQQTIFDHPETFDFRNDQGLVSDLIPSEAVLTLENLMSHRSGLGQNPEGVFQAYRPGIFFDYSNLNFSILYDHICHHSGSSENQLIQSTLGSIAETGKFQVNSSEMEHGNGGIYFDRNMAVEWFQNLVDYPEIVKNLHWYGESANAQFWYPGRSENGISEVFIDLERNEGYLLLITFASSKNLDPARVPMIRNDGWSEEFPNARQSAFVSPIPVDQLSGTYISAPANRSPDQYRKVEVRKLQESLVLFPEQFRLTETSEGNIYYPSKSEETLERFLPENRSRYLEFQTTKNGIAFLFDGMLYLKTD